VFYGVIWVGEHEYHIGFEIGQAVREIKEDKAGLRGIKRDYGSKWWD